MLKNNWNKQLWQVQTHHQTGIIVLKYSQYALYVPTLYIVQALSSIKTQKLSIIFSIPFTINIQTINNEVENNHKNISKFINIKISLNRRYGVRGVRNSALPSSIIMITL